MYYLDGDYFQIHAMTMGWILLNALETDTKTLDMCFTQIVTILIHILLVCLIAYSNVRNNI